MTSKLDYLKKYLAQPGEEGQVGGNKGKKEKKKRAKASTEPSALRIRDLSEALPKPREERKAVRVPRLTCEEDLVFVDEKAVAEAQKVDVEMSGVRWRIQQHRPQMRGRALQPAAGVQGREFKQEQVKQEPDAEDGQQVGVSHEAADSDLSPPRAKLRQGVGSELSSRRAAMQCGSVRAGADADRSSPRKGGPQVKEEPASDGDISPPRRDSKAPQGAPAQRLQSNSDADLSPPRKRPAEHSDPKRRQHDSGSDISPPRRGAAEGSLMKEPAEPAGRQRQRHDSDSDLSPPLKGAPQRDVKQEPGEDPGQQRLRHASDSDLSPPRKREPANVAKQERRGKSRQRGQGHDSDSDLSPPRKSVVARGGEREPRQATGLQSQRKGSNAEGAPASEARREQGEVAGQRSQRHDSDADLSPPRGTVAPEEPVRMSSGLRAGLVRGSELKEDAAQVRAERRAAVEAAPAEETGRDAGTVYRDKTGKKVTREEFVELQQKKRRKRLSDYPEQELEWGGGIKQRYNKEEEMAELERIAAQPFARFEPDSKYMEELRERQDWNDPMRHFEANEDVPGEGIAAKTAEVQRTRPKCPHPPWPNRFNILPGYRWDGKVRGNNFEKRWLEKKNQRAFERQEQWKYDMMEM
mmetsp:Transcript_33928/g.107791  ORF Transcript_33928/g.107791 Transcript_33928/m.107791 type:complete len:637 (-) Transcript_33928:154-2064(-)